MNTLFSTPAFFLASNTCRKSVLSLVTQLVCAKVCYSGLRASRRHRHWLCCKCYPCTSTDIFTPCLIDHCSVLSGLDWDQSTWYLAGIIRITSLILTTHSVSDGLQPGCINSGNGLYWRTLINTFFNDAMLKCGDRTSHLPSHIREYSTT